MQNRKRFNYFFIVFILIIISSIIYFQFKKSNSNSAEDNEWVIDFFDDFNSFNDENWQDQRIWVNNEEQCYVPNGNYGTRLVSDGTLKLKVINIGSAIECDNFDKHGNQHH